MVLKKNALFLLVHFMPLAKFSLSAPVKGPEETAKVSALILVVSCNNMCNNSQFERDRSGTPREAQQKIMLKDNAMQNHPFKNLSTGLFDSVHNPNQHI